MTDQTLKTTIQERAANWTTQAWQTHCNNIDWFGDLTECCLHRSGDGWRSCHGYGWATISGSGVLCYNLAEGYDCCEDGSVCDANLGCCDGTCCQTATSETVCKDGCISLKGLGCKAGTCAFGENKASPTKTAGGTAAGATGAPATSSTGVNGGDGGLSRSDKIALGCGIGIGLPATLAALWVCMKGCLS